MEQTDQLQQANTPVSASQPLTRAAVRPRAFPLTHLLWRYRVLIAGMLAIGLALAGEILMRQVNAPVDPSTSPGVTSTGLTSLGSVLVGLAMLLVGFVAWVNDGPPFRRERAPQVAQDPQETPVRTRAARPRDAQQTSPAMRVGAGSGAMVRSIGLRYSMLRTRAGWYGTAAGLAVAAILSVWLVLILRDSWHNPIAGWVWLAIMLVLLATFVGVKPWPRGATLVAHDPAEPAFEPPVARIEWIVLGVIMVAAVVLRLWHLDSIPAGPYIDESGRALDARNLNYGLLVNREPFVFFGTGWWGVPSFYFWLVAQSMKVFGDNLLGARVIHALAGIGTVWYTYHIGRIAWSPRVGLVAGALIAVSDFAIQASRTAGESTITLFFWTACFYYLYKAIKTRHPADFVLSGLAGGFVLLGYASGKLLPLFLIPVAVYILLRWGFTGIRRYLSGLALMGVTAAVVCAPNLIYQFTQKPNAFTERYNSVTIFTEPRYLDLAAQYRTDNWGLILANQFEAAYSAYDVTHEKGPFYPTGQPVLPLPWAVLWVLGTAYVVWRLADLRYAILACWLLGGLAGSAFTTEAPTLQRALMVIPLLALLPAIFLDRLARGGPYGRATTDGSSRPGRPPAHRQPTWYQALIGRPSSVVLRRSSFVSTLAIVALVLLSAFQTLTYYFGPYTAKALYIEFALAGQYMEKLNPNHDVVYDHGLPVMFGDSSPLLFLGKNITRHDLGSASEVLPVVDNGGRDVHFMVSPPDDPLLAMLRNYYPGGESIMLSKPDGTPVTAVYRVTADEIDNARTAQARYMLPSGVLYERQEPRLGTYMPSGSQAQVTPPSNLAYPTRAEWLGGLVSPAYGTYRMRIDASAGATLEIDGRTLLTDTAGIAPVEDRVVLSKGMHTVRLSGTLSDAAGQIELLWGTDNGDLVPVGREFLWGGPAGTLAGEVYGQADPASSLTAEQLPAPQSPPILLRHDGVFSWSNINETFQAGGGLFAVWRGTLAAAVQGNYGFEAITPGAVTIWIDGKLVGVSNVPGMSNQWPVNTPLAVGEHRIEMRFYALQDSSPFQLYWQPAGKERTLFSPDDLLPAQGGAWPASETTPAPGVDSSLIHSVTPKDVEVTATIPEDGWTQTMGIAVLPDGRFAVGDSGGHKLLIYDADGKQHATWGGATSGADTFNDVSDIAVRPDGAIIALDAENADIRVFDENGKQTAHLPAEKMGLTHARGIAVGPDSKYYVADTAGGRVVRVSQSGDVEKVYQQGNGSIKDLDQPIDVAVGPDGSVYAVDLRKRIVKFDPSGRATSEWQVPVGGKSGGSKLALWNGLIVVSNPDGNSVSALDTATSSLQQLNAIGDRPLSLNTPTGVAVGPNNELYLVDSDGHQVIRLKATAAPR